MGVQPTTSEASVLETTTSYQPDFPSNTSELDDVLDKTTFEPDFQDILTELDVQTTIYEPDVSETTTKLQDAPDTTTFGPDFLDITTVRGIQDDNSIDTASKTKNETILKPNVEYDDIEIEKMYNPIEEEPFSISEIIASAVYEHIRASNQKYPKLLVITIESIVDFTETHVQVEPLDGENDCLKVTVHLPLLSEDTIEFDVTVQNNQEGFIEYLSEDISNSFNEAIVQRESSTVKEAVLTTPMSITTQDTVVNWLLETHGENNNI